MLRHPWGAAAPCGLVIGEEADEAWLWGHDGLTIRCRVHLKASRRCAVSMERNFRALEDLLEGLPSNKVSQLKDRNLWALRGMGLTTRVCENFIGAMSLMDRIRVDPNVRFGVHRVGGTRISAGDSLEYLASGMSGDQLLAEFPQPCLDDIRACLACAVERDQRTNGIPASTV